MLVKSGEEITIFQGLYDMGLVAPLRAEELIYICGRPLLNGMFGVGKGTYLEPGAAKVSDETLEVLRLIMNLTATNSLCRDFPGDIEKLPYHAQWRSL